MIPEECVGPAVQVHIGAGAGYFEWSFTRDGVDRDPMPESEARGIVAQDPALVLVRRPVWVGAWEEVADAV